MGEAASTRQRVLGLIEVAKNHGWETEFYWVPAYQRWNKNPLRLLRLLRYAMALKRADDRTVILVQRTLRCREFLYLLKKMRPHIKILIADFDDAVWLHSPRDFRALLEVSDEIWCGSQAIVHEVTRQRFRATFVPTLIQTELYDGKRRLESVPVIGWIGDGYAHEKNLAYFANILQSCVAAMPPYRLRLIGIGRNRSVIESKFSFLGNRLELIDWAEPATVPQLLSSFSIGVMPLVANAFNAGKCGLKILEYMTAGIPVIASDIGENTFIVQPPLHGFLASTHEEWKEQLICLLTDQNICKSMGERGRAFALQNYDRSKVYGEHLKRLEGMCQGSWR